jgi:hypothetical protein
VAVGQGNCFGNVEALTIYQAVGLGVGSVISSTVVSVLACPVAQLGITFFFVGNDWDSFILGLVPSKVARKALSAYQKRAVYRGVTETPPSRRNQRTCDWAFPRVSNRQRCQRPKRRATRLIFGVFLLYLLSLGV